MRTLPDKFGNRIWTLSPGVLGLIMSTGSSIRKFHWCKPMDCDSLSNTDSFVAVSNVIPTVLVLFVTNIAVMKWCDDSCPRLVVWLTTGSTFWSLPQSAAHYGCQTCLPDDLHECEHSESHNLKAKGSVMLITWELHHRTTLPAFIVALDLAWMQVKV